jgi:hypothetical protein
MNIPGARGQYARRRIETDTDQQDRLSAVCITQGAPKQHSNAEKQKEREDRHVHLGYGGLEKFGHARQRREIQVGGKWGERTQVCQEDYQTPVAQDALCRSLCQLT